MMDGVLLFLQSWYGCVCVCGGWIDAEGMKEGGMEDMYIETDDIDIFLVRFDDQTNCSYSS